MEGSWGIFFAHWLLKYVRTVSNKITFLTHLYLCNFCIFLYFCAFPHLISICSVKRSLHLNASFYIFPLLSFFLSSLIILRPSEAQIREGGFLAENNTTVFVQRRRGNRWLLCYVFDPFVVEFYTDCDTCAFKMRNREPIKVVRHISRIACHIGTRSGRAVCGETLQCTKSHCLKPKLCAADPYTNWSW